MFLPGGMLREKLLAIGTVCGAGAIGAEIERIAEVDIRPQFPSALYVDGEVIDGVARLRASCLPGALTCIAAEPRT